MSVTVDAYPTADESDNGLFVLVPAEVYEATSAEPAPGMDDGVEEHGPREWVQRIRVKKKTVDLSRIKDDLAKVQAQAEKLLASLSMREIGGMQLEEVQLSLGVTAEGSIGVVTAGVEAAIALTYRQAVPPSLPRN
jgi:hypothetical protein